MLRMQRELNKGQSQLLATSVSRNALRGYCSVHAHMAWSQKFRKSEFCLTPGPKKTWNPAGVDSYTVLPLLETFDSFWGFFRDLGIFRIVWKCVKWTISVYFANHIWFFLPFIIGTPILCFTTTDLGKFWYCSRDFWSCVCESLASALQRNRDHLWQGEPNDKTKLKCKNSTGMHENCHCTCAYVKVRVGSGDIITRVVLFLFQLSSPNYLKIEFYSVSHHLWPPQTTTLV